MRLKNEIREQQRWRNNRRESRLKRENERWKSEKEREQEQETEMEKGKDRDKKEEREMRKEERGEIKLTAYPPSHKLLEHFHKIFQLLLGPEGPVLDLVLHQDDGHFKSYSVLIANMYTSTHW